MHRLEEGALATRAATHALNVEMRARLLHHATGANMEGGMLSIFDIMAPGRCALRSFPPISTR